MSDTNEKRRRAGYQDKILKWLNRQPSGSVITRSLVQDAMGDEIEFTDSRVTTALNRLMAADIGLTRRHNGLFVWEPRGRKPSTRAPWESHMAKQVPDAADGALPLLPADAAVGGPPPPPTVEPVASSFGFKSARVTTPPAPTPPAPPTWAGRRTDAQYPPSSAAPAADDGKTPGSLMLLTVVDARADGMLARDEDGALYKVEPLRW